MNIINYLDAKDVKMIEECDTDVSLTIINKYFWMYCHEDSIELIKLLIKKYKLDKTNIKLCGLQFTRYIKFCDNKKSYKLLLDMGYTPQDFNRTIPPPPEKSWFWSMLGM